VTVVTAKLVLLGNAFKTTHSVRACRDHLIDRRLFKAK